MTNWRAVWSVHIFWAMFAYALYAGEQDLAMWWGFFMAYLGFWIGVIVGSPIEGKYHD